MVRSVNFLQEADWLNSYVVAHHPDKELLRQKSMKTDHPWAALAGWNFTASRVRKNPEGLDLVFLLNRIQDEMGSAAPEVNRTMNFVLQRSESTFLNIASEPFPLEKHWEFIGITQSQKVVLHLLPKSGLMKW